MIGAQKSNQLSMLENCCISVVQDNLARPSLAKPKLQQVWNFKWIIFQRVKAAKQSLNLSKDLQLVVRKKTTCSENHVASERLESNLWVFPPPYLEKLQIAASCLGLFVLRPMQLLPSGVSWTEWLETCLDLSRFYVPILLTSTAVLFPVDVCKQA